MSGKDGEKGLNEGQRDDKGELPGRIAESHLLFTFIRQGGAFVWRML